MQPEKMFVVPLSGCYIQRVILCLSQSNKHLPQFHPLIFPESVQTSRNQHCFLREFELLSYLVFPLTTCLPTDSQNRPTRDGIPDGPVVSSQLAFRFQRFLALKVVIAYHVQMQVISSSISTLVHPLFSLLLNLQWGKRYHFGWYQCTDR